VTQAGPPPALAVWRNTPGELGPPVHTCGDVTRPHLPQRKARPSRRPGAGATCSSPTNEPFSRRARPLIKMQRPARGRGAQLDSSFPPASEKASLTAGQKIAPAPLAGHCELQRVLLWAEAEVHPAVKYLKCKKPRALGEGRRQRPRQRKCKLPGG
jgi:hypothetical protein